MSAGAVGKAAREVSQTMQVLGQLIDSTLKEAAGERVAFTLMAYAPGRASYITTAPRADTIRELRALADYLESGMPHIPAHQVQ